jgi:hypothetical protein
MNRSARSLLAACVITPVVAALAVAAAPANAVPGPSTRLLYDTATAADPVTRALPEPVVGTAGRTAEKGTGAVDEVLRAAPAAPGLRAERARCKLNPGKDRGVSLPDTPLPVVGGQAPLDGLRKGRCPGKASRTARDGTAVPVPAGPLLGDAGKLVGGRPELPSGLRTAAPPMSMAVPGLTSGLPDVPSMLVPAGARQASPGPAGDLLGQANGTLNKAGAGLGGTDENVGSVVDVLKARNRAATPADGPLSMPGAPGLGLPNLPGLG